MGAVPLPRFRAGCRVTPERKTAWDARVKELNKIRLGGLTAVYVRLKKAAGIPRPAVISATRPQLIHEILTMEFPEMGTPRLRPNRVITWERTTGQGAERTIMTVEYGPFNAEVCEVYYVNGQETGNGTVCDGSLAHVNQWVSRAVVEMIGAGWREVTAATSDSPGF